MSLDQVHHLVTLTLVHFLWEGLAIGVMCAVVMRWIAERANARYGVGVAGLLAMAAAPLVTFVVLMPAAIPAAMPAKTSPVTVATADVHRAAETLSAPVVDKAPVVAAAPV